MYRSANEYFRSRFSCKVYKLALEGGATCPNRDGRCGRRGCIFCSGSGEFAEGGGTVEAQIQRAKGRVAAKAGPGCRFLPYFQSFTATYLPPEVLESRLAAAMAVEDTVGVAVATRPDCLPPEILSVLEQANQKKPVFVELGLQTIHEKTARWMRRGYDLPQYDEAVSALRVRGLEVITHMIAGLPGESRAMTVETARYIGASGVQGIKIHLLHVLRGTDLEKEYEAGKVPLLSLSEYVETVAECLRVLPETLVIHRLTGDGDKRTLVAPLWSADKKRVLNALRRGLQDVKQGENL